MRVRNRVVGRQRFSLSKRRCHEVGTGVAPKELQMMLTEDCAAPDLLAQGSLVAVHCAE
jgi:hypothetical protein